MSGRLKIWNESTETWDEYQTVVAPPRTNSQYRNVTATGLVNGSNKVYTLPNPYIGGSVAMYVGGIRDSNFTETSPTAGTITTSDAFATGEVLRFDYDTNYVSIGSSDTVDGIHASATPVANQLLALDSNSQFPTSTLGGAWTAYTPAFPLTSGGAAVWGNSTFQGDYRMVGKTCEFRAKVVLGTTANFSGLTAIGFTLPFTAATRQVGFFIGQVFMMTGFQMGRLYCGSNTTCNVWAEVTSGTYNYAADITGTIPHGWASTHYITVQGSYEVA